MSQIIFDWHGRFSGNSDYVDHFGRTGDCIGRRLEPCNLARHILIAMLMFQLSKAGKALRIRNHK